MRFNVTTKKNKTVQGFAVELYFDIDMENAIRGFREKIYAAGVEPISGKMGDRPHISLAVFNQVDVPCLKELCKEFASHLPPFPVSVSAVGSFPTADNVLFLSPVPTIQLLQVHHEFHDHLKCSHLHSSSYYHPGKWIPHCTIELELPDEQLSLAFRTAHALFAPIKGEYASLGIVSFRPVQYLAEYQLQKEKK
jgi:2'-5' RNA ligase